MRPPACVRGAGGLLKDRDRGVADMAEREKSVVKREEALNLAKKALAS